MKDLCINLPEKISTNVFYRMHFSKRHLVQQDFYTAVQVAVRQQNVKPITEYPVPFVYRFYVPGKQLDHLNLGAMAKMVEDGLRHCGTLEEDTPAFVAGVYLVGERSPDKITRVIVSWGSLE